MTQTHLDHPGDRQTEPMRAELRHSDLVPPADSSPALELVTERLRHARLRVGIAQRFGVADRFGWDYPSYVAHERGQVSLSLMAAKQYAKGFGVSVEWLLYGVGEMDRRAEPRREPSVQELREEVERLSRENAALLVLVKSGSLSPD